MEQNLGRSYLRAFAHQGMTYLMAMPGQFYRSRDGFNAFETGIKFEIIHEGRIEFDLRSDSDQVCGISTLSECDLVCSNLLANSDRWADVGVFSRDLIDLAMMEPALKLLRSGLAKAEEAYGISVERDLLSATERLKENPATLDRCIKALNIEVPKALLWQKIKFLTRVVRNAPM